MINIYPSYYKSFKCIAGNCPDTCCAKWEIVVDGDSANFYIGIKTSFGERLQASMKVDDDGDTIFINKNKRCPFLNDSGLCDIYTELGEDCLCSTCEKFPRFSVCFGGTTEYGLSLSCPAACELIMNNDLALISDIDDSEPELNELDADLFLKLKGLREEILSNRDTPELTADFDTELFKSFEYLTEKGREVFLNLNSDIELRWSAELRRIYDYYIYRYLLASVYDGCESFALMLSSFAVRAIFAASQSGDLTLSEAAVLFSKEIEHSDNNLSLFKTA